MKNKFLTLIFCFVLLLFTSCKNKQENKNLDKGKISISGAFALYPLAVKWAEEYKKINPRVKIDISAGGAGKGITDVLSGMVDIGMVSREIKIEEESKGAWKIAVTKDAVIPVINKDNPIYDKLQQNGLDKKTFQQIFLSGKSLNWGNFTATVNKSSINVYVRSDACGAAEIWAEYLGKSQEDLNGIGVFGDPGIADAVKKDKNGIGFNNVIYAYDIQSRKLYDGLAVVPIDINENGTIDDEENIYSSLDDIMNGIKNNKYPSPPARELYFVFKNKPEKKIIKDFLKWILTEGQQYVKNAGYVTLSDEIINQELNRLK